MLHGLDISHWQDETKFDWVKLKENGTRFIVARASYGRGMADRKFTKFAELIRANGFVFGAYHFYRMTHPVEEQLALFEKQLQSIGGLSYGTDMLPVLDMEENQVNSDGKPIPSIFGPACEKIANAFRDKYGGCILYYSSFFLEYLGVRKSTKYTKWVEEPGFYSWLADYSREPGNPRTPYTILPWAIHQPKPRRIEGYSGGVIDYDVVNPSIDFNDLLIPPLEVGKGLSTEACQCECQTTERPGGAG